MFIGVPKEIKVQEYRVGLTPAAARLMDWRYFFTENIHRVWRVAEQLEAGMVGLKSA